MFSVDLQKTFQLRRIRMANDLFNKYIWLVDTIYRSGKITFKDINKRWLRSSLSGGEDLPLKTFHNWRREIEQIFDINIECRRRGGYHYYIENADDMEQGGIRNWLLNTFAVNNLINESHHLKRRILFEEIPSGRRFLTPVIEAMRDGLEIEFSYQSYWHDGRTYTVQPYCIKVFRQRWYVLGFCKERDALRLFSLDRIVGLKITDVKFKYPKDFDPVAYFADSFGIIMSGEKVETVRLKANDVQRLYLRGLPLHHSQQEVETGEWHSVFEYRMRPSFDLKQEILSMGASVEVLSPAWFRDEVAGELRKMSGMYGE